MTCLSRGGKSALFFLNYYIVTLRFPPHQTLLSYIMLMFSFYKKVIGNHQTIITNGSFSLLSQPMLFFEPCVLAWDLLFSKITGSTPDG